MKHVPNAKIDRIELNDLIKVIVASKQGIFDAELENILNEKLEEINNTIIIIFLNSFFSSSNILLFLIIFDNI